jgi:1,4-alpha-glucan branching enzyme
VYRDPDSRAQGGLHASHFRGNMEKQAQRLAEAWTPADDREPTNAELYGPWWYEGPLFLGDSTGSALSIRTCTAAHARDYLARHRPTSGHAGALLLGLKGYNEQWLNETNAWTYRHTTPPASAW